MSTMRSNIVTTITVKAPTIAMSKFAIAAIIAFIPFPIAEHTLPIVIRVTPVVVTLCQSALN
ncbi:hypothetical protein PISMIDRAFT_682460, partial [Pisolithus microcarpus 441]